MRCRMRTKVQHRYICIIATLDRRPLLNLNPDPPEKPALLWKSEPLYQ